ncbi:MAG: hypothetical protein AAF660_09345 [Pseudomonadota bacterium]
MSHPIYRCFALIAAALFVAPAIAQDDSLPRWMQKEMRKEVRKVRYTDVTVLDGQFAFRVPNKLDTSEAFEGGWYFASDIRAGAPMECYLFYTEVDMASTLSNMADINIDTNAAANGAPLSTKRIYGIDAGQIDGSPYLSLEWLFTLGDGAEKVAGFTKVRAAYVNDVLLACGHNSFGYRETFAGVFEEFVSSAKTPSRDMPSYYEEIFLQRIGDMNVGFTQTVFARDEEGDSRILSYTSTIAPAGIDAVSTSDSSTSTWSTADGAVINAFSADAENGELSNNLQLSRNDDGDWVSYGTYQGKEISYVIDGDIVPLSELGQMRQADELFDSETRQADMPVWLPSADPSTFITGVIEKSGNGREARLTLGPIGLDARFDEHGSISEASFAIGANTLQLERVWVYGEP